MIGVYSYEIPGTTFRHRRTRVSCVEANSVTDVPTAIITRDTTIRRGAPARPRSGRI